ncbi:hypothetical protein REPUB_Repub10bG0004300 [Reevesia pubescens]
MAETKSPEEPALSSAKRKPDLISEGQENLPLKSQKLQTQEETIQAKEGNHSTVNHALEPSGINHSSVLEPRPENEEPDINAEEEEEEQEEDEDDDDDYENDDDHDEENGIAADDRKGKGILIEEEKDDDDSSDGGNETEGESDLSDDPLAEVDLDNILPSRTRRRVVQPGVCIAKDVGNNGEGDASDA